ncbi:MAG: hypothetical protein B7L53_09780 [Thermofilum sp. NZ13]|nr:MAG: hypothetical protein B7L53_09780 [Thermofilum sp. NZ13]
MTTAQAKPVTSAYLNLTLPWNQPFANKEVVIVFFNESYELRDASGNLISKGCIIAYAVGKTDSNGQIWLTLSSPVALDTSKLYTGSYNMSVFWREYGKTFLLNSKRYNTANPNNRYNVTALFNQTVHLAYIYNFSFQAITQIGGQQKPLWLKDNESGREDKAYFEVRLDPNGPIVFHGYGDNTGTTSKAFLVGAIQVNINTPPGAPPTCYHIESYWNTTFYKDIYWMLITDDPPRDQPLKVKVGSETLNFSVVGFQLKNNGSATGASLVITENIPGKPQQQVQLALPGQERTVQDTAYTYLAIVSVRDLCGNMLPYWQWPPISVEIKSPSLGWLRRGGVTPGSATAPKEGLKFVAGGTGRMFFWLPNTTLFYNENQTINVEVNDIQVFTWTFNTINLANESLKVGNTTKPIFNATKLDTNVWNFTVRLSLVKVRAIVKDSGGTLVQPLEGAMVIIEAPGGDPINTYTDGAGYIRFPPFNISGGGSTQGGTPIIVRQGSSPGYLPVPFGLLNTSELYTYRIKVFYAHPGSEVFVEVRPKDNVLSLNLTKFFVSNCTEQSKDFIAPVYNVDMKVIDLCDQPLTPLYDPNAALIITYTPPTGGNSVTFKAGLGKDGTVSLGQVPGGTFKVQLFFKGALLSPVEGTPDTLNVTGNVDNATFRFPVGDVTFRITEWDSKTPIYKAIYKVDVTLEYYKNDTKTFAATNTTDCYGEVKFTKVPLKVDATRNRIILKVTTRQDTPYIRPQDAGLVIGWYDLTHHEFQLTCATNEITVPAWVFSFTLEAVDHTGENVLSELPTSNGKAPVIVALNDTYEAMAQNITLLCQKGPGCLCWPNVRVTYKIFNATGNADQAWGNGRSEAVFRFTGSQFENSKYPHLYMAGATYSFLVWHSGVMVYNYTFRVPAPSAPLDYEELKNGLDFFGGVQTLKFNETSGKMTYVSGKDTSYTWLLDAKGRTEHPIAIFYGAKSHLAGGNRYETKIRLVTWVVNLDLYTVSKLGAGLIPGLNATLFRNDAANWTKLLEAALNDDYSTSYLSITKPNFAAIMFPGGLVAWSAVDDDKNGVISVPVAVWMPGHKVKNAPVKFGASILGVFVLAGDKYGTPNVPDTPQIPNSPFYGYIIGPYNATTDSFDFFTYTAGKADISSPSPTWYKLYGGNWVSFRGNNSDYMLGGAWNVTYWSGVAKVVYTSAMEGFCVQVYGRDLRDNRTPLANQPVTVVANGRTGKTSPFRTIKYTGSDGVAIFSPVEGTTASTPIGSKPVYKDDVAFIGAGAFLMKKYHVSYTDLNYTLSTQLNLSDVLKPYGLSGKNITKVLDPDTLSRTVVFNLSNNIQKGAPPANCVPLEWDVIKVTVFDWSGKPLQNMMVAAILREPRAKAIPSVIGFTDPNGNVVLLVPPPKDPNNPQRYQLLVYWRDSYLLRAAGKIPKEIVIFDTVTDYDAPRTYAPGAGTTLETFVYVAKLVLTNAQGGALSQSILDKITVTVTWPDSVVTQHKPATDGSVILRLAKDTVKSWPFDASSKYSPETPADHGQAPHGAYQVVVDLAGVGTVAKQSIKIEKGRFETSLQVFQVKLDIYDVQLTFTTPFGTPMAGATVTITTPDGRKITDTLDSSGSIAVKEVPPGSISFSVDSWKGLAVGYTGSAARQPAIGVTVPTIGKLTVKVLGARGQGIEGATVAIEKVGTFTTDASGVVTIELPQGSYAITASKGGRTASTTANVAGGKEATAELKLDIFLTIAGWEMSSSEFLGLILLLILLVLVIFIIAHEYSIYRRRRLAKVIAPAEAGTQTR